MQEPPEQDVGAPLVADLQRPSRRWAAKRFTDIRDWNELDRGGHVAAFEQPGRQLTGP